MRRASSSARRFCWLPTRAPVTRRSRPASAWAARPRPGADRKLSGKEEALLVATACSSPPEGRARWTLELLADELVRLTEHDSISRETVRRRLVENDLKPWRKDMWCIPQVDGEYVARMEDVLDFYAEAPGSEAPSRLLRRKPHPAHRRGAPADPGQAGADRALRLRVSPQRDGEPVRLPRCAPLLAQGEGHRAARRAGLRRLHARTCRCALSGGGAHPGGARQPVHPFGRRALPNLPG